MGKDPFPVANDYFRLLVHGNDKGWDWKTMDYAQETQIARDLWGGDAQHLGRRSQGLLREAAASCCSAMAGPTG